MGKKVLITLVTGIVSGLAVGLGGWLWKTCAEPNADKLKKEYDKHKADPQKQGN